MTVRDTEKYRRRNPAPALAALGEFRVCTVIPCYNENGTLGDTLESLRRAASLADEKIAFLIVVNFPQGADAGESLELLERLEKGDLAAPDVFALYAPELKGGVGEARKIGMDCFLQSCTPEKAAETVICSMDGDTLVEEEYFKYVIDFFRSRPEGGVSIGLRHLPGADEAGEKAIRRYESYLERYAAQLKRCGSPYGFHTVGSAFAVRGESYMKCGGMKVRQAGEDFYFLQAVAKTSGVGLIEKILVHPSARVSARTPFGTGQAVRDLLAGKGLNEIPDAAFDRLANLLAAATAEGVLDSDSPSLPDEEFFRSEKFFKVWPGIRRNTPRSKLTNAFHIWFDGLKTLRFLHRVSLP